MILVDDGLATGSTMRAAVSAHFGEAISITVAVPIRPSRHAAALRGGRRCRVPLDAGALRGGRTPGTHLR